MCSGGLWLRSVEYMSRQASQAVIRADGTAVRSHPHTREGKTIIVYSKFDAGVVCHKCLMTELRDEVRL